jgi:hypothetical protein
MQQSSIFVLRAIGRSVSFHASFSSAVEAAPAVLMGRFKSVQPTPGVELTRWQADTSIASLRGFEIVEVSLVGGRVIPESGAELPRRPRFELRDGAAIGVVSSPDIPLAYTVQVLSVHGVWRYRSTDGSWVSKLFDDAEGAILAAQQRERGLLVLARLTTQEAA